MTLEREARWRAAEQGDEVAPQARQGRGGVGVPPVAEVQWAGAVVRPDQVASEV